jgi:hypothetical protein
MIKFLSLNRIVLFLILMIPWIFFQYYPFESIALFVVSGFLAITIWLVWLWALDDAITRRIPPPIRPSNQLFQINVVILYINAWAVPVLLFIFGSFQYSGLAALPFLFWGIYSLYAFLAVLSHLSKILTYAEKKEPVMLTDRLKETIGFAFFPVGIWWLQPRIQVILKKPVIPVKKYIAFTK